MCFIGFVSMIMCIYMQFLHLTYIHGHSFIHLKPARQWLVWTADGIMVSVRTIVGSL